MNSNIFPITVIVAISIFLIKEFIELYRRIMADKRKILAIKKLLANEIEKNNWVVKSLKGHLEDIKNNWFKSEYKIIKTQYRGYRIEVINDDGSGHSSLIFEVSTVIFDKILFELPVLDSSLFEFAEKAYEGIAEVKYITECLIEYIINQEDHIAPSFIIDFSKYGLRELEYSYEDLCILYRKCTDKDLSSSKLRTYT